MRSEGAKSSLLESYALLYSTTLVLYLPSIVLLGTRPRYSYDPLYLLIMVAPPLLAMVLVNLAENPGEGPRRLALTSLIYGVGGMILGGALFLALAWPIALLGPAFAARQFEPIVIGLGFVLAGLFAPLPITAWRRIRRPGAINRIEAVVAIIALAAAVGVIALVFRADGTLVAALRKDQLSYLVGGIAWYLPAYSLTGGALRLTGIV